SYIENLPRRGYRLIASVAPWGTSSAAATDITPTPPDLAHVGHAPLGHIQGSVPAFEKSIAVLPFINLSSDQENEYFGDGLAEEILNALSHIPELHVAARSSTFTFKNKGLRVSEIAERLRVATVLEGSVRRAADRLRITVQLI